METQTAFDADEKRPPIDIGKRLKEMGLIADEPGMYRLIDPRTLEVDHSYQREASAKGKINSIRKDWSWMACGVITVGLRAGKHYVIDGQYRTLAARGRNDIREVPCLVFRSTGPIQEAIAFLRLNTNRKPLDSLDKFRAEFTSGDPTVIAINDLLRQIGRAPSGSHASAGANVARCLTALKSAYRTDKDALVKIWPLIGALTAGKSLHVHLLRGLFYIERHMQDGQSLADRRWYQRALKVGADGLIAAAHRSAGLHGHGADGIWAAGMVIALNKGMRQKLSITGDAS